MLRAPQSFSEGGSLSKYVLSSAFFRNFSEGSDSSKHVLAKTLFFRQTQNEWLVEGQEEGRLFNDIFLFACLQFFPVRSP
jgi:hypothetical protein